MATITMQQAYALALGAYQSVIKANPSNTNYTFSIASGFVNETTPGLGDLTKQNNLRALLSGAALTLPNVPGQTSDTAVNLRDDEPYFLIASTATGALTGSPDFFGNTGLHVDETNYHLTGLGIMNKLKK